MAFKVNANSGIEGCTAFNLGGINRNKIHNGEFRIHQRTIYHNPLSDGDYVRDRWAYSDVNTDELVVINTNTGNTFRGLQSLKIQCATPETTVAADEYSFVQQKFEGNELADLVDKTFFVQFMARSEQIAGGTLSVALTSGDATLSYVQEFDISTTTSLYNFVVEGGIPSANQSNFNINTIDTGMYLTFTYMAGSNVQTSTLGSWQAGNFVAGSNQTNFWATAGNAVYLAEINLCVGDTPVPFVSRPYAEELAICQRYYVERYGGQPLVSNTFLYNGFNQDSTTARILITYPQPMRIPPTISVSDPTHFQIYDRLGTHSVTDITFDFGDYLSARANVTGTAFAVGGEGCLLYGLNSGPFSIKFDAEL